MKYDHLKFTVPLNWEAEKGASEVAKMIDHDYCEESGCMYKKEYVNILKDLFQHLWVHSY